MNVILNPDSKLSQLYRWFYNKSYYNRPENFCPYFWSLVWMFIAIIPFVIFITPGFLFHSFQKNSFEYRMKTSIFSMLGFFMIVGFFRIPFVINFAPFYIDEKSLFLVICDFFGILSWFSVAFFLLIYIFHLLDTALLKNKKEKSSIIISFIKAKYNKVCPTITWKR